MLLQTFMLVLNNVCITVSSCMLSGLEPEIQKLISKHKQELKKLRVLHEAELLQADERAAQRYVRQTEELRQQLERERDEQCQRERELAKQRYACPYILTCVWCTESSVHQRSNLLQRQTAKTMCSQMLENTNTFKLLKKKGRLEKSDRGS